MAPQEKKPSFSLHAFVEQTAQMLRNAAKTPSKKRRSFKKDDGLSNMNRIQQIAFLIRSEAKKLSRRKKRSD